MITRFRTQKIGALLAYLAFYRTHGHPRERLIEMFWPETEPESGRHSLSLALSSLRNQLEPPGVPAGAVLVADRYSVELNPDAFTTDVLEFEQALRIAAQGRSGSNYMELMTEAIERYGGPLLPGYYEEWIPSEQERLAQRYQQTVDELLRLLEKAGAVERAIAVSRRGVSLEPLYEPRHRDLMRLLAAAGQVEAARQQYRQLERLLDQQLGEEPSETTRQLARELFERAEAASIQAGRAGEEGPTPLLKFLSHPAAAPPLPVGTVTFLFTDIEGSTTAWEKVGEAFRSALTMHHALLRREFRRQGGQEVREAGDSFLVAFANVSDALTCAVSCQRALAAQPWPEAVGTLRVRMALHTGDIELEEGEYHGLVLHHAARILSAAHGGQILCSEATAALLRRDLEPGIQLKDLGVYRLRSVEMPERLFQVEYAQMTPGEFPPPNAEPAHAAHLPLQFTRFFGREQELAKLQRILHSKETRILTLTGPGGTGKTRLAIEAAGQVAEKFSGAVWFVPLADLSDPSLMAGAIVEALHIPRPGHVEPLEQAVEALAKQPSLLILDNFEQLVEGGAEIVQTLLERAPKLTLLLTSRQILNLPGERAFPVPPLPTPNGPHSPQQLSLYESVRLFVDRAQAVKPDFQVTNSNAAAVAELCDRLEGMPLAIELAAARAQVLTPAQMLQQLGNRFELLVSRKRGVVERQRTLRAAIDWSYRLLSPDLQRLFARLSVFRGGWTAEAAEAVCEEPLALDLLAQLRECSLILTEETDLEIRFRMLETLREYALDHLTSEEYTLMHTRHRDYFLALVEEAEPKLQGPDQTEWLERLETEHDNLRAALGWCKTEKDGAEVGLRLAGALCQFWRVRGYWSEGRAYLAEAMGRDRAAGRTQERAIALNGAGMLAWDQGDYEAAKALHGESLAIRQELGDKQGIAIVLNGLGIVVMFQGDFAAARVLYEQSLAIQRELGDKGGIAGTLLYLGNVASSQGDYEAAKALHEQSLAIRRELVEKGGIAASLINLGVVAEAQGDYEKARELFDERLAIMRELGDKRGIASSLGCLGNLAYRQGDYEAAKALYEESLAVSRELGDKQDIALLLMSLGNVAKARGNYAAAKALIEESLALRRELGDKRGIAYSLSNLGDVALKQGDYEAAKALYEKSLAIKRELGHKVDIAYSLGCLGNVALRQGNDETARTLYEQSLAISRELGDKQGIALSLEWLARLAGAKEQPERAARLWVAAEALRGAISVPLSPDEREEYNRNVAAVREALSEEAFAAAWVQGRAMTLEQAIAYALEGEAD